MVQHQSPRRSSKRESSLTPASEADPVPPARLPNPLPLEYTILPTVPSPFAGTLDASLDAILEFARLHPDVRNLTAPLLARPDPTTNWPVLFAAVLGNKKDARLLLEELFFLIARKLLPEQIAENRRLMLGMYMARKLTPKRVVLRYDMLREWSKPQGHILMVESRPPPTRTLAPAFESDGDAADAKYVPPALPPASPIYNVNYPHRPPLRPNIITTLIAAPSAYANRIVATAMKHHVTELDRWLLMTDEGVAAWAPQRLIIGAAGIVLHWQWLRDSNEILADMEVDMWRDLDGKADDNDWVMDFEGPNKAKGAERKN